MVNNKPMEKLNHTKHTQHNKPSKLMVRELGTGWYQPMYITTRMAVAHIAINNTQNNSGSNKLILRMQNTIAINKLAV